MSLQPGVQLTIGNARYGAQVIGLSVQLGPLPAVNYARITLPIEVTLDANTGTSASLVIEAGGGWKTLLEGKVRGRTVDFQTQTVILTDASADLAAYRPNTTFQAQEAAAVVKSLAGDVSVGLEGAPPPFGLAVFAVHDKRTAAEHLADLAKLTGSLAVWTERGKLQFLPLNPLIPTKALRYGRDFTKWRTHYLPRAPHEWVAVGHGPAGVAAAPNALLQTKGTLPSDRKIGAGVIRQVHPLLRTPLTAQIANQGLNQRAQLGMIQASAKGLANPALRPGVVLEVQDLPNGGHPSTWLITRVSHYWHPHQGAATHFHGWSTETGPGTLGALAGLV